MSYWRMLLLFVLLPILVESTKHRHSRLNVTLSAMATKNSIYFDVNSKTLLKLESNETKKMESDGYEFVSRGLPCSCTNLTCGCCAGININSFNFTRQACTNVTLMPEEFAMDFRIIIDGKEMLKSRISARNPPPVCMPLYFLPIITFCVRFYDVRISDAKLNACIDFETKIAQWPIFLLHFDCVRIGSGQVAWVKPEFANLTVEPSVAEIYDDVNFETIPVTINDTTSGLTPEEEDQIGTLKS